MAGELGGVKREGRDEEKRELSCLRLGVSDKTHTDFIPVMLVRALGQMAIRTTSDTLKTESGKEIRSKAVGR